MQWFIYFIFNRRQLMEAVWRSHMKTMMASFSAPPAWLLPWKMHEHFCLNGFCCRKNSAPNPAHPTHAHLMITSVTDFLHFYTFNIFCRKSVMKTSPFIGASGWQVRETQSSAITAVERRLQKVGITLYVSRWEFCSAPKISWTVLPHLTYFNDISGPSPHSEERENKENEGLHKFNTNSLQLL